MGHFTIIVVKTGRLYISLWGFNKKEKKAKRLLTTIRIQKVLLLTS